MMRELYTVLFVRKSDQRVLRRFNTPIEPDYFLMKKKEEQLKKVLDLYTDLEKKDIEVREYKGAD